MSARTLLRAAIGAAALSLATAGCTLGPDFERPSLEESARWKTAVPIDTRPLPERWWTLFADPELDRLVDLALTHNHDLESALARVEQARAYAGVARAAQSPTVSIDPSVERRRYSANRSAPPGANSSSYTDSSFDLPLDVAYEVDLWGRVRRAREAAEAFALATEYDHDALALAISSEVARTYLSLRSALREEEVLREGADLRRRALDIMESRERAGVGNDLDTSRTRAELATVEADRRRVERGRVALENALAVLCGSAPSGFAATASTDPDAIPAVPAGLPSELLRRRPDVAAAIERMHEAGARVGMTEAEAYPRLALTGSAGFVSSDLSDLFDASSRAWSLGGAVSAPIFAGGEYEERNRAARAFYDERAADYRGALLTAFREVEDALSALEILKGELDFQLQARTATQRTFQLAEARYAQGLVGYLDVVDAARSELDARRDVVQLERVRAESTVLLIQALGGGWDADAIVGG